MELLGRLGLTFIMSETLESLRSPLLITAALTAGLQAGTYYTWASGVMPGLARVDDRTFVHAVQQMNLAIVNPVFMTSFLGAPLAAIAAGLAVHGPARPWVVAGAGLAVATVAITVAGNVPLNNALEAAGPVDSIADLAGVRDRFESRWVALNVMRALTSTASLAALVGAAVRS